ncbi:cytoplasmic 60S subunit biogenesis factor ZNF622 [Periophthalmus magnuspinnatus]|uniref:cytoplasmic 60S subunit biogenesis factor ZNF622 n=1 Tax=Periophthalmus magnuspinnatus TaxID=409849 RepID=UPI0024363FBE|nr:cytoplasmic 60S subunit biogenesis factor ZNF622 [Periophthalmus magnuspinnatus]
MASYTCISCRVAFGDGDIQRAHYKTDWHRYNLKRKVADMPPVTAENFQERVLAQRAAAEKQQAHSSTIQACDVCNKKFSSDNAYQNHLKSHKHQQAEKQALRAAQSEVDRLNEKNLEKGLGPEEMDNDAKNAALQEALKRQQRPCGSHQEPSAPRVRADKPPRYMWLEEQAKRRDRGDTASPDQDAEEEWEDLENEEDENMSSDEEEQMEQAGPVEALLPGSIPVTDCLFCSHHSRTLFKNVAHMTRVHGFFIPDIEFLVDLRGLIQYLGEKVGAGNVCLWCNEKGRSFYSTEAVKSHMTDKSHCKVNTEGDAALEFADFYDFRSSYPDRPEEGDMETEDSELPEDKTLQFDEETLQLTLPSGAIIGHRSLMRYYKQRFGPQRAVALSHSQKAVGRLLRQYKALGWTRDAGGPQMQRQKDMQYVQMMKSKWMLKVGMSHNTTRQKHFRAQVMF